METEKYEVEGHVTIGVMFRKEEKLVVLVSASVEITVIGLQREPGEKDNFQR